MTNKVNFDNYKFHCSGLPNLMTESRSKSEALSKSAQAYLDDIYLGIAWGRSEPVSSPAMEKGTIVESDSLQLYCEVTGQTLFKNNKQLQNGFVAGTPDVKSPLIDIKSSFNLRTFHKANEDQARSDYFWQLAGYAMLRRVKSAKLVYALVNTPEHIIYDEVRKLSYSMPEDEAETIVRKNHEFDDIPKELRIKEYLFKFTDDDFAMIKDKVMFGREYLNNSKL